MACRNWVHWSAGWVLALLGFLAAHPATALVSFDTGRREIDGVLLLADADDPSVYYYLPQTPRLAAKPDGSLELLCLKYVDPEGKTSGGLFHALVEMTLAPEDAEELGKKLAKQVPGARLAGALPLLADEDDGEGGGSFRLVSAVLSDRGEGGFTRSVVASDHAPVTPGSRAVVAAVLDERGATLLWESLTGNTSDVSVEVSASYEARVPSYGARVHAEIETVYRHFSEVFNRQEGYEKRQIRDTTDQLIQSGAIQVEVTDRGGAGGGGDLEGVLDLVTQKLTETFFDHQTGWSREPSPEPTVEADQLRGRQRRGFMRRLFGGAQNTEYYSDDQWVLKQREEIRRHSFTLDLTRQSTVRVRVATAGNLSGIHHALGEDERYFRTVSFDDPDFELRPLHFQVDSAFVEAFGDVLSLASVELRQERAEQTAWSRTLTFTGEELAAGNTMRAVNLPRLGASGGDWLEYGYRARWSLRGGATLTDPPDGQSFRKTTDSAIVLAPPLSRRDVEIDLDAAAAERAGVSSAVVEFATLLGGEPGFRRRLVIRPADAEPTAKAILFFDRGEPVAYRVSWHGAEGTRQGQLTPLDSDYLYLRAPDELGEPVSAEVLP